MNRLLLGHPEKKDDFKTIDIYGTPDIVQDLNTPLTITGVDEIQGYHVLEHLHYATILDVVKSWHNALVPGGMLILELPDFDRVIGWYLMGESEEALKWIFGEGSRVGQTHYWGWNKERLYHLLKDAGFETINFAPPQDYHIELGPCLRVEAKKGAAK